MILIADVHDADVALARVAALGEPLLILGDLANLIDYRNGEGIVADVVGIDTVRKISRLRSKHRYEEAAAVWHERVAGIEDEVRERVGDLITDQYERAASALGSAEAYVTYGNVDRPDLLAAMLPPTTKYVDAEVLEIEGWRVGIVGGGVPKLGTEGEVSPQDMAKRLARIGHVDVLCTHVPPAIEPLARDVIGRGYKGSKQILDYIDSHQPQFHFFGDVHQPRAVSWEHGATTCRNVGYFRATGRGIRFPGRAQWDEANS